MELLKLFKLKHPTRGGGTKGCVCIDMNQGPNYDWMTIWSSLPQQAQQNLVNPPTKAIGDGLGGIFTWVFHKPIEYLAVEQAKVESVNHH